MDGTGLRREHDHAVALLAEAYEVENHPFPFGQLFELFAVHVHKVEVVVAVLLALEDELAVVPGYDVEFEGVPVVIGSLTGFELVFTTNPPDVFLPAVFVGTISFAVSFSAVAFGSAVLAFPVLFPKLTIDPLALTIVAIERIKLTITILKIIFSFIFITFSF